MQEAADDLRDVIRRRYEKVATSPDQETKFPVGANSAKSLGYDTDEIDALPPAVTEAFCGVGNPLALGELHPGQTILDVGSGGGLDSILAGRRVGPNGRVIGVDMTKPMVDKATRNAAAVGANNIEFRQGHVESLSVEDASVDVVISNGVLNLCPDKPAVLAEAFRVLRGGGRLQMADILLHEDVTPDEVAKRGTWSD